MTKPTKVNNAVPQLAESYTGSRFTIIHCEGAIESFNEAIIHVPKHKQKSYINSLIHQINRLSNGHPMSKENFPQEGELPPSSANDQSKRHFHALKRKPLRGYCWKSEKHKNTYYISHYVYKDYKKLKQHDTDVVGNNWKKIEGTDK